MSKGLGLPREGQNSSGEGEHKVSLLFFVVVVLFKEKVIELSSAHSGVLQAFASSFQFTQHFF